MSNMLLFVNSVCRKWGLPEVEEPDRGEHAPVAQLAKSRRRVAARAVDSLPWSHSFVGEPFEPAWTGRDGRFLFVVDCQPLSNVICGKSPLDSLDLECCCQNITENLKSAIFMGWRPPRPGDDPVLWQKRDHNRMADHLVNATMDMQKS